MQNKKSLSLDKAKGFLLKNTMVIALVLVYIFFTI